MTNGEQPSVENSTHHQSWDAQRATPDDPKNGLMNGPRCQRHIPHPRHNATTHLHLIDHVTMWPYFRMTWGTTTNLREKNKTWFPSQLFVAQTWCRMPKKKDRQRMFITKRIKNAQKFICEKNLHGWCRSVCSHKYTFWHGRSMSFFPYTHTPNMLYIMSTTIEYVPVRVGFVSLRVGCQILSSAAANLTLQSKFFTNLSLR